MKRIISILVFMSMTLCSVAALADTDTMFDAMQTKCTSAQVSTEFYITLNKPLNFLKVIKEEEEYETPFDYCTLAEGLLATRQKADMSIVSSEDCKDVTLGAESELSVPFHMNENFKADIWAKVGLWLDMDVTDKNKPVFDVICKLPFSSNYMIIEYKDLAERGFDFDGLNHVLEMCADEENRNELGAYVEELIVANTKIKEVRRNQEYVLTTDDAGFKAIAGALINKALDIAKEQHPDIDDEFYEGVQIAGETLSKIPVVGKDGMKVTVRLNKGKLSSVDCALHVDFNIYDIMELYGEDVSAYNRDDWAVDLTINMNTTYSKFNEKIDVPMPPLTEYNSDSILNYYKYDDYTEINTYYPVDKGVEGALMIPLRDGMAALNIDDYNIAENTVNIADRHDWYNFEKITLTLDSDEITVDGVARTLSEAVVSDDGLIVVPHDLIEIMSDTKMSSAEFDMTGHSANSVIFMPSDDVEPDDESDDSVYDEYEYDPEPVPSLYMSVDGSPVVRNGELYIPAKELAVEMNIPQDSISYEGGIFTVVNSKEHPKEFGQLSVASGSNSVKINGVEHIMKNPACDIDGALYVPAEFLSLIDCTLNTINYYFEVDRYSLRIIRNKYFDEDFSYGFHSVKYAPYREYANLSIYEDEAVVKDENGYYLPLRPFMGELMVRDENITIDGDAVTVLGDDPATTFEKLTIKGNAVTLDGTEHTMKSALKDVDGRKYVPAELLTDVLGGELTSVDIYYQTPSATYRARIRNPLYDEDYFE